jgi:hypothetical protein
MRFVLAALLCLAMAGCAGNPKADPLNEWMYASHKCTQLDLEWMHRESETLSVEIYVLTQINLGNSPQHYEDKVTRMQAEVDALEPRANKCDKWASALEPK